MKKLIPILALIILTLAGCSPKDNNNLKELDVALDDYEILSILHGDLILEHNAEEKTVKYVDSNGEDVLTTVQDMPITLGSPFIDGYATVSLGEQEGMFVIDDSGEVVLTPTENNYYYKNLGGGFFERTYTLGVSSDDVPQGVVNANGDLVYSGNYWIVEPHNEYAAFYSDGDFSTYGMMNNETFETITEIQYEGFITFVDGISVVLTIDQQIQIVNDKGEILADLTEKYDNIASFPSIISNDRIFVAFSDGSESIIVDNTGEIISQTEYEYISTLSEGASYCIKDGKFGYIDEDLNEMLEPIYDDATLIINGRGYIRLGDKQYEFSMS